MLLKELGCADDKDISKIDDRKPSKKQKKLDEGMEL